MSIEIGDMVKNASGKVYVVRGLINTTRYGAGATLQLPGTRGSRHESTSSLTSLSLMRSRELRLAYHYAAAGDRERAELWLTMAEQRNDDSRAELCMGTDRILELEAVAS